MTAFYYSNFISNKPSSGIPSPTILNDISNQFNGSKTVFALKVDQSLVTTIDTKDLEIFVNGLRLTPYIEKRNYPWIVVYDSFNGFRIRNSYITIYKAPRIGYSCNMLYRYSSHQTPNQVTTYPFAATTIALGD